MQSVVSDFFLLARFVFCVVLSLPAQAQQPSALNPLTLTDEKTIELTPPPKLGWKPELVISGQFSFSSNDNVIGQQDGDTTTLGTNAAGGLHYFQERYEWRNNLKFQAATSKNPTLARYIKSTDDLRYETLYIRSLEAAPWIGPYARASAETTAFKGEDVRQQVSDYQISRSSGVESFTGSTLKLTDAFRPLTTKESVGAFAKLLNKDNMKLEARLGLGAMQVEASQQLALADKNNTTVIEVNELKNFTQAGLEGGFTFKGVVDKKTTYSLSADFLTPFIKDLEPGDDRDSLELTNYEVIAKLSSKVFSWMSMDYEYKLKKQPQLLDKNQIQHIFLVNLSYTIF